MHPVLHVVLGALLVLVHPLAASGDDKPSSARRRPNVLVILVDDLGWRDVGCFGSTFYETPHVDALAARGMRFSAAYASPVCSPSRASFLTGKYPQRVGVTDYISRRDGSGPYATKERGFLTPVCSDRLALEETTLAEAFAEAGYATFFAGKWHLGPEGFYPEDQGFEVNKGGWSAGHPVGGKKFFSPYGNPRLSDGPPGEHLDDRLAAEAVRFIERQNDKPFFAMLSLYSVHTPIMAPQNLVEKYEKKIARLGPAEPKFGSEGKQKVRLTQDHAVYAAMIEVMDRAVGKVTGALAQRKLDDDTIVLFASDNGGLSTAQGHPTSNAPLRAGKGWLYEGGVRVPAILVSPRHAKPASSCDVPVSITDWYPTLLELAGLAPRAAQHVDGVSLTLQLKGEATARGPIFWHYPHFANQGGFAGGAVRDGRYKLVEDFTNGRIELFDLSKDIGETTDLSQTLPQESRRLLDALKRWQKSLNAQFPKKS